jgi:hypothetical protein
MEYYTYTTVSAVSILKLEIESKESKKGGVFL